MSNVNINVFKRYDLKFNIMVGWMIDGWKVGWKYGLSEDTRIIEHCELKRKIKVTKEYISQIL